MCSSCNKGKKTAPRTYSIPLGKSQALAAAPQQPRLSASSPAPQPTAPQQPAPRPPRPARK